jgi:hypothetical protein
MINFATNPRCRNYEQHGQHSWDQSDCMGISKEAAEVRKIVHAVFELPGWYQVRNGEPAGKLWMHPRIYQAVMAEIIPDFTAGMDPLALPDFPVQAIIERALPEGGWILSVADGRMS